MAYRYTDVNTRTVYNPVTGKVGGTDKIAKFWLNADGTGPVDVGLYTDGDTPETPGASTGSNQLEVQDDGMWPAMWDRDGDQDHVYIQVGTVARPGDLYLIYCDADQRMDALDARVADLEPGGDGEAATATALAAEATARANADTDLGGLIAAEATARAGADTAVAAVAAADATAKANTAQSAAISAASADATSKANAAQAAAISAASSDATTKANSAQSAAISAAAADATSKVAAEATARGNADALLTPATRTIATTAPLTGGGDLSGNRTLAVSDASTGAKGVVQLAGDLTGSATAPTIATGAVTSAKIADGTIVNGDISGSAALDESKFFALVTVKTGNYTITSADSVIEADSTSGGISINLPNAATVNGRRFTIKRISRGINNVTVVATFSQVIDGGLNVYTLTGFNARVTVISNGTGWRVVSGHRSGSTTVLNVRDFGAKLDGIADDTVSFQDTIDASITSGSPASTTRSSTVPVYFPRGQAKITAPLTYTSVQGPRFFGDGRNSEFFVSGNLTSAIALQGVANGDFADFSVRGATASDTVTAAITLDWDGVSASRSSTANNFRHVGVRNLKYVHAIAVGLASSVYQCDQFTAEKCEAYGQWTAGETTWWQTGFVSGSGVHANPLNHNYFGCISNGNRYNLWANACNVLWDGGLFGYGEADVRQTGARKLSFGGFRTEHSQRLLVQDGGASYLSDVAIRDVHFDAVSLAADGRILMMGYPGEITIDNLYVEENGANPTLYYSNASSRNLVVSARSIRSRTAIDSFFTSAGVTAPIAVDVRGYNQIDASGAPVAVTSGYSSSVNGTTRPRFPIGMEIGTATLIPGVGSPEGAVAAPVSSIYLRSDGAAGTSFYVKESGTGNTGWVGK